jgi:hypothetical protein
VKSASWRKGFWDVGHKSIGQSLQLNNILLGPAMTNPAISTSSICERSAVFNQNAPSWACNSGLSGSTI